MITATAEIADNLAKVWGSFLSRPSHASVSSSPSDIAVMQRFADTVAALLDVATQELERGWSVLAAGRVENPLKEGQVILHVADLYVGLAAAVEEGPLGFESSNLVSARQKLERERDRYQREWPMISPDQIDAARKRYDAAAVDPTFDDAARALGHVPEKAPRELSIPGWSHLVLRRHPWKRQLFIRGRNMTVRQLVGTVRVNGRSEEEAAKDLDCSPDAIREALRYADANKELLAAEAEYEYLFLSRRGLIHTPAEAVPKSALEK